MHAQNEPPLLNDESAPEEAPFVSPDPENIKSITRLVVGGLGMGVDEFIQRLRVWEIETERLIAAQEEPADSGTAENASAHLARYALIGLVFELQESAKKSIGLFGRLGRFVSGLFSPVLHPLISSPLFTPTQKRIDRLIARGQAELDRWVERGRREDAYSRRLASTAVDDVVEGYIEYLAENPEVQELVQSQSTGLANEVVEEVRERTVSADTFLEGMARSLLGMTPRTRLPDPPGKLRQSAESLRPPKKRPRSSSRSSR